MRMLRRHGQHVVLNLLLLMKDVSLPGLSLCILLLTPSLPPNQSVFIHKYFFYHLAKGDRGNNACKGGGGGYFIALEPLQCWKQSKALLMSRRTAVNLIFAHSAQVRSVVKVNVVSVGLCCLFPLCFDVKGSIETRQVITWLWGHSFAHFWRNWQKWIRGSILCYWGPYYRHYSKWVRSFGMIRIKISDPRSLGSW